MAGGGKSGADGQGWSEGPPLPRWVFWLMVPGMVAPVLIFGFILWTKATHDPERCPYREFARREIAAQLTLLDEARSCVAGIEEHRYTLLREGQPRLLGERSFDQRAFAPEHYRVSSEIVEQGEVQVIVHNDGHDDVLFREGTAREHEQGVSLGHRSARDLARARAAAGR